MRENVIIAYRGANYELGQWPHGYGIWSASSQEPLPLEWWDPTPDGWSAAWYRFAALEVPGTIVAVSQPGSQPPVAAQTSPPASAQPGPVSAQAAQAEAEPLPATGAAEDQGPSGSASAAGAVSASQASTGSQASTASQPDTASQASTASQPDTGRPTPFFADQAASHSPAGDTSAPSGSSAQPGSTSLQPRSGYPQPGGGYAQPGTGYSAAGQPSAGYATQPGYAGHPGYGQPTTAPGWARPHPGPSAAEIQAAAEADARPASPRVARISGSLLAAGVILGIIGLFPAYLGKVSLASQPPNLWPHVLYLAAWAVSAVLIFRGGLGQRVGALVAAGTSVVTLGLFIADVGYGIAGAAAVGAGLVFAFAGWLACAAGSVLAFGRWPLGWPRRPFGREATAVGVLIAAAIGTAVTFAPSWDSYLISSSSSGISETITEGNAFANPGVVIFGDVLVMVALVAVIVLAALWRPARIGWALVAGALVPILGQVLAAVIQVTETTTPTQIGIPSSDVSQYGLTVQSSGLTTAFWLYCVFVAAVIVATAWLAFGTDQGVPYAGGQSAYQGYGPGNGYGGGQDTGASFAPAGGAGPSPTTSGRYPAAGQPGDPTSGPATPTQGESGAPAG